MQETTGLPVGLHAIDLPRNLENNKALWQTTIGVIVKKDVPIFEGEPVPSTILGKHQTFLNRRAQGERV
jgi:hypothetical protein